VKLVRNQGADVVGRRGRQHRGYWNRKMPRDPARSETLRMHGNILRGNREIPCLPEAKRVASGRIGKSKDSSQ
jgi:hypothetical protein